MSLKPVLQTFLDKGTDPTNMDYTLFGAPLDKTTSNRRGVRFGPGAIRCESIYLDSFSARTSLDLSDLNLADIGDLNCINVDSSIQEIENTIKNMKSFPVMLGGEHTITLGALRALRPDHVIVYDAHLDLRNELFGESLCHATYLRRGLEELIFKAIIIGARSFSNEEIRFLDTNDSVEYLTAQQFFRTPQDVEAKIIDFVEEAGSIYLSLDMDVLDPAYAPAVGNPHPEGLSTTQLMNLINSSMNNKLVGFDLNEVYPHYDTGITAITSAYIVMETLYSHIKTTRALGSPSHVRMLS